MNTQLLKKVLFTSFILVSSFLFSENFFCLNSDKNKAEDYNILVFGTPVIDRIITVDNSFLNNYSFQLGSWRHIEDPLRFQSIIENALLTQKQLQDTSGMFFSEKLTPGGSAANTTRVLAQMGNQVAFFGPFLKAGESSLDDFYRNILKNLGVHLLEQFTTNPISEAATFISYEDDKKNRTFATYPNRSLHFAEDLLPESLFHGVKLVHFEGYIIKEYPINFVRQAMKLAKKVGAIITFDLGSDALARGSRDTIFELLKNVDILFANQDEARALFETTPSIQTEFEAASILSSKYGSTVVICRGDQGSVVYFNNGLESIRSDAYQIEGPIDPNADTDGAGDSFIAGFLHAYLREHSLSICATLGNILGGTTIAFPGAEISIDYWLSLREKIQQLLEDNNPLEFSEKTCLYKEKDKKIIRIFDR